MSVSPSLIIPCPHCEKKIAVRSELAGKRLACPHCKQIFEAPVPEAEPIEEEVPVAAVEPFSAPSTQPQEDHGLSDLANLIGQGEEKKPQAVKKNALLDDFLGGGNGSEDSTVNEQPAESSSDEIITLGLNAGQGEPEPTPDTGDDLGFLGGVQSRSSQPSKSSTARAPATAVRTAATPQANQKSYAKKKAAPPIGLYIGGGVAGVVLLIGLIAYVASLSSAPGGKGSSKADPGVVKWGLAERERKHVFCDLLQAIDRNGQNDTCRREWKGIQTEHKINDDVTEKILNEGFDTGWEQPAPAGSANAHRHRIDWIAARTKTKREPLLVGGLNAR